LERGVLLTPRRDTVALLADALNLPADDRATFLAASHQRGARDACAAEAVTALETAEPPSAVDASDSSDASPIHTFLIADIRGSTTYTVAPGDEAWAKLAMRFAAIAREVTEAHGGRVLELRGDEVLADFGSVRSALLAAIRLQARLATEAEKDQEPALRCGIGLDAGEAVAVEGGYRSLALNLAARLCSIAGPGEVLASETVISLAHTVPGLTYAERSPATLKGFPNPVRIVQVLEDTATGAPPRVGIWQWGSPRERLLFVAGSIGAAAVLVGLLTLLNLVGYRDDVQYAATFLGWAVLIVLTLTALASVAIVGLGLVWRVGRAQVLAAPVLSVALLVVAVALPFASPLLTSACGTLVCPAAAPEA
jgi:class 3 adenylate cyclase